MSHERDAATLGCTVEERNPYIIRFEGSDIMHGGVPGALTDGLRVLIQTCDLSMATAINLHYVAEADLHTRLLGGAEEPESH